MRGTRPLRPSSVAPGAERWGACPLQPTTPGAACLGKGYPTVQVCRGHGHPGHTLSPATPEWHTGVLTFTWTHSGPVQIRHTSSHTHRHPHPHTHTHLKCGL